LKVEREQLKYWLALTRAKFALPAKPGGSGLAGKLKSSDWEWVEKELDLIEGHGVRLITLNDRDYPASLLETYDPPILLYIKGTPPERGLPMVAVVGTVVGTRRASPYGLAMAERVSRELAEAGVIIVSGMARGCDSAAHRGALSAGRKTVAVLGTGIDCVYPRENKRLYDEIAKSGLLMSELPMASPPLPRNFPMRNRIISGMSLGVLVVEAPLKSGAMTTAKLALDDGREVFAMPGMATSKKSTGAVDILDALSISYRPSPGGPETGSVPDRTVPDLGSEVRLIMDLLEDEPLNIDGIVEKTGLSVQRTSAVLLDMELRGLIEQQPGKIFMRRF
jgi:DNA processing protein